MFFVSSLIFDHILLYTTLSMLARIIAVRRTFMQGKDFSLSKKKAYQYMIDISIKYREQYFYSRIHSIHSTNRKLHRTMKVSIKFNALEGKYLVEYFVSHYNNSPTINLKAH